MRIIPAIDIIDGKCVRLTQGDYAQKTVYNENPLEIAKEFEDAGLQFLHLVDLDGAKAGRVTNWTVVENISTHTKLSIDFGGGIKTSEEISKLLAIGVKQVNLGSIAVKNPAVVHGWITTFGSDKIILSADVKKEVVQISGWQENAALKLNEFVSDYQSFGISTVVCTDIATDGMLSGPNIDLYTKMIRQFPDVNWIASGGVSNINDLQNLKRAGLFGAIVGKAIYEGRILLKQLSTL